MLRFLGNACAGDAGAPSAQALAVAGDALLSENTNLLAVATAGASVARKGFSVLHSFCNVELRNPSKPDRCTRLNWKQLVGLRVGILVV